MDYISAILSIIGQALGFAKQRDSEKNTAPIQAAAEAKQEQQEKDAAIKAVATRNTAAIEKALSE